MMEPRTLEYVARATGGQVQQGNPGLQVTRVCTDTRHVEPGDLFVALKGPRFNGHNYLAQAVKQGAAAVMIEQPTDLDHPAVTVNDTRVALGHLGSHYRTDFDVPVVAIAGSNGKTTTKNLAAHLLKQGLATLASEASFNNDIGVPLTLLRLESQHQVAVLEAGTNHPGELAPLLRMIRPRFGLMTGLGDEHLEFFNDLDGVAAEEGWLAELLPANGRLFINGDSPAVEQVIRRSAAPVTRVGVGPGNDWRATMRAVTLEGTRFTVEGPDPDFDGDYLVRLLGQHQLTNALLALALGRELGLAAEQVKAGLASCPPSPMRLEIQEKNGVYLLNDSYNANVDSTRAALETCRDLPCKGRRMAFLGDMAELGTHSPSAHETVGRFTAERGMDVLIATGQWHTEMKRGATEAGLKRVEDFEDPAQGLACLMNELKPGDLVLLKASRAAGFDRLGRKLLQEL